MIVCSESVKLSGWLIVIGTPSITAVKTYLCTSVIGNNHPLVVFGCNPQIVVIAVWSFVIFKSLATVC